MFSTLVLTKLVVVLLLLAQLDAPDNARVRDQFKIYAYPKLMVRDTQPNHPHPALSFNL